MKLQNRKNFLKFLMMNYSVMQRRVPQRYKQVKQLFLSQLQLEQRKMQDVHLFIRKGEYFNIRPFITGMKDEGVFKYRSVGFTKIQFLKRSDFLSCLKCYEEDYEKFCSYKDSVLLNEQNLSQLKQCSNCNSEVHDVINCEQIHFTVDRERVIKQYQFETYQQRQSNFRRNQQRQKGFVNARIDQEWIQEIKEYFQSDNQEEAVAYSFQVDIPLACQSDLSLFTTFVADNQQPNFQDLKSSLIKKQDQIQQEIKEESENSNSDSSSSKSLGSSKIDDEQIKAALKRLQTTSFEYEKSNSNSKLQTPRVQSAHSSRLGSNRRQSVRVETNKLLSNNFKTLRQSIVPHEFQLPKESRKNGKFSHIYTVAKAISKIKQKIKQKQIMNQVPIFQTQASKKSEIVQLEKCIDILRHKYQQILVKRRMTNVQTVMLGQIEFLIMNYKKQLQLIENQEIENFESLAIFQHYRIENNIEHVLTAYKNRLAGADIFAQKLLQYSFYPQIYVQQFKKQNYNQKLQELMLALSKQMTHTDRNRANSRRSRNIQTRRISNIKKIQPFPS